MMQDKATLGEKTKTVDDLATVRTGDKGDTLILGVVALEGVAFEELERVLSPEVVAAHFGLAADQATRTLLPQLGAMSFALSGVLGEGVTGTGHLDGHGKTLSYHLLGLAVRE